MGRTGSMKCAVFNAQPAAARRRCRSRHAVQKGACCSLNELMAGCISGYKTGITKAELGGMGRRWRRSGPWLRACVRQKRWKVRLNLVIPNNRRHGPARTSSVPHRHRVSCVRGGGKAVAVWCAVQSPHTTGNAMSGTANNVMSMAQVSGRQV